MTGVAYPGLADWHEWHEGYDDPGSEMAGRLRAVRAHVAAVVDEAPPGLVTVVSICGGEGREVIGALDGHPRRGDVRGRLVELDPNNAATARRWANVAGLAGLEVVHGDASKTDAYDGLAPADLVVISGLFGHLDDDDQQSTIEFLRQLCRPGGSVVWTLHREETRTSPQAAALLRRARVRGAELRHPPGRRPGAHRRARAATAGLAGSSPQGGRSSRSARPAPHGATPTVDETRHRPESQHRAALTA